MERISLSSRLKKTAIAAVFIGASFMLATSIARAQSNPTYNTPVFNSFTNAEGYGDERDFMRIAEPGTTQFDNELTNCSDGAVSIVSMYVHNNAADGYNAPNNTGPGVATGVKVSITSDPTFGSTAQNFTLNGRISAANAATVNDTTFIKCGDSEYQLDFVPGSGRIYSSQMNGVALPDALFTPDGTTIGWDALNGVVPGCWEYRAFVQAQIRLTKIEKPVISKSCDALTLSKAVVKPKETVVATATATANNATITGYIFTVKKDGVVIDTKEVATSATSATYNFSQSAIGNYVITATVKFADGNVTSAACEKMVEVKAESTPPTTIPNTGAGNVLGLLAVTTIAGAVAHRIWTLRKN